MAQQKYRIKQYIYVIDATVAAHYGCRLKPLPDGPWRARCERRLGRTGFGRGDDAEKDPNGCLARARTVLTAVENSSPVLTATPAQSGAYFFRRARFHRSATARGFGTSRGWLDKSLTRAAWSGGSHNQSRTHGLNLQPAPPEQPGPALQPSDLPHGPAVGPGGVTPCAASITGAIRDDSPALQAGTDRSSPSPWRASPFSASRGSTAPPTRNQLPTG